MAVTLDRTCASRRLNIDIAEDNTGIDPHRGDVGDMDGVLAASEPMRRVMNDGRRRDLHLRREQVVSGTQAAGAEDISCREGPSFSPEDDEQDDGNCCGDKRGDKRW